MCWSPTKKKTPTPLYITLPLYCSLFSQMWILPKNSNPLSPVSTSHTFSNCPFYSLAFHHSLRTMDPIKIEKLQAMKRYRGRQLLPTFIQYCLTVVFLGLFLSSPHWIPPMLSSIKFFLASLPSTWAAIIFRPKCLFIVSNIIIIFLVGESKLSKDPPTPDVYEEYMERRQSLQRLSCGEVKVVENAEEEIVKKESLKEESVKEESAKEDTSIGTIEEDEEVEKEKEEESGGIEGKQEEEGEMERECEELYEEEEMGLPTEELNRRVEDFIAKFNMERRLEERMLVCHG